MQRRSPTPPRKRRILRLNLPGRYYGMGPQVEDAVSGWWVPRSQTVRQRGRLVSADRRDGSLDEDEDRQ